MKMDHLKILLLAGGESEERAVSLDSSWAIYQSLKRLGHTVDIYDPATGEWIKVGDSGFEVEGEPPVDRVLKRLAWQFEPRKVEFQRFDMVFVGLHGGYGEDGSIQTLLDMAGVSYTGSGRGASVVGMNKDIAKHLMKAVNIPTPAWSAYFADGSGTLEDYSTSSGQLIDFPAIVKPTDGGSTLGLSKVDSPNDLMAAVLKASRVTGNVMVEKYIEGREVTAAVLDGEALPLVEIVAKSGLYDYEAKYSDGGSSYIVPAGLDDRLSREIRAAACRLYRLMGASGVARIDFRVTEAGNFYCLELNTLPGMTELSLVPMAAKAAGLDFDGLVVRMLQSANSIK